MRSSRKSIYSAEPPAADRAPLYIDPKPRVRITLDGPALRLRTEQQAERFVPLRRLSRIVANARTEFTTAALLACAERGITIMLVNAEDTVAARILGQPGERQEIRQRLLDLQMRVDWPDLYKSWKRSMATSARMRLHRRLSVPRRVGIGAELDAWLDDTTGRYSDPITATNSHRWLEQLADAWMLNHVNQLGFGADSELFLDGWPNLIDDLSRLLHWELEPMRLGLLRRRHEWTQRHQRLPDPLTRRDVVTLFQKNGSRIGRSGRYLTNRLHKWLVDTL